MNRIATVWIVLNLLLPVGRGWGQETDSLFFQNDSLTTRSPGLEKGLRLSVAQQRVAAEPFMKARIHFTSDFIRRFTDQTASQPTLTGMPSAREVRIRSLFDGEDGRLARRPTGGSAYADLIDQFVEDVGTSKPARVLTDPNEQLYAAVLARATWQQQDRDFTVYLKKSRSGMTWAWEIIGAEAVFLTPNADATQPRMGRPGMGRRDSLVFIPPNAHELNFMGLAKQLRSGNDLAPFISATSAGDPQLMALAQQLATGQLRLQTLLTTTLWLNTQVGWLLELRQFNRETDNSGWLISDLCRSDAGSCLPPVLRRFMNNTVVETKP